MEEILAQLEEAVEDEDVESADAVIIPPEADALTDNEDIDDDCTGNVNIEDVAGSLELHVAAQISNEEVIDDATGENAANHSEINFETKQAPNKKEKYAIQYQHGVVRHRNTQKFMIAVRPMKIT